MHSSASGSRNLVGILLVALGVIFLLDTLDVFGNDTRIIRDFWPILIIGVGVIGWAQRGFVFDLGPVMVMVVGVFLLVGTLSDGDVWQFWPVFLIVIGLWFVWRRRLPRRSRTGAALTGDGTINATSVFGGNAQQVSGEFKGGRVTAILGDGKLNLRDATLPADGAVLDVSVILGSYEVMVPATWKVIMSVDAFLGSAEDKRSGQITTAEAQPTFEVQGSATLGSVEIKS